MSLPPAQTSNKLFLGYTFSNENKILSNFEELHADVFLS
jgi:hypothetical protein